MQLIKLIFKYLQEVCKTFMFKLGAVLNIVALVLLFYDDSRKILNMTPIKVLVLFIICVILTSFEVYKKTVPKYILNFIEDNEKFIVDKVGNNFAKIEKRYKLYVGNTTTMKYIIDKMSISLGEVNKIKNDFIFKRLIIKVGELEIGKSDYECRAESYKIVKELRHEDVKTFPYTIEPNSENTLYFSFIITLESKNEEEFKELLNWIKNIKIKVNYDIYEYGKPITNKAILNISYKDYNLEQLVFNKLKEAIETSERIGKMYNREI